MDPSSSTGHYTFAIPTNNSSQPRNSTSYSRNTTSYLRYLHINHDLTTNGKLQKANLRVMVLGIGCINPLTEGKHPLEIPQPAEIGFFMRPGQSLHLVDHKEDLIGRARREGYLYDLTAVRNFFMEMGTKNKDGKVVFFPLMEPVESVSKETLGSLFGQIERGVSLTIPDRPKHKYICWDPQVRSPLPSEIQDTYDVIVATCSALFPEYIADKKHMMPTWAKILGLLKHEGLLYVDSTSYRDAFKGNTRKEELEALLSSRFVVRKIKPIVRLSKARMEGLRSNSDVSQLYGGGDYKHHIAIATREIVGGRFRQTQGVDSHSVYVIQRQIDRIEALKGLFLKMDMKEWWHRLAKTEFNQKTYSSSGVLQMQNRLIDYSYVSEEHHGWTPLHVAVLSNNPAAIEFFLSQNRPEMEQADEYGMTPADYACLYQPHLYRRFWPGLREEKKAECEKIYQFSIQQIQQLKKSTSESMKAMGQMLQEQNTVLADLTKLYESSKASLQIDQPFSESSKVMDAMRITQELFQRSLATKNDLLQKIKDVEEVAKGSLQQMLPLVMQILCRLFLNS